MPASYPTAVKTFTTKNAGDTIQPAHINDLQDEVVAIEQGLLGGVSPFQSSNSTLANLSVPGASTFTGNVKMDGTLTVNKIVSTSIAAAGVTSYIRAYAGSPFQWSTVSSGARMACDQEVADLLGEWDSTLFTFTPQSSGYYNIVARGVSNIGGLGDVQLDIWVNDALAIRGGQWGYAGASSACLLTQAILNLSSGTAGAVQVRARCVSTGRMSSGITATGLEIIKLF